MGRNVKPGISFYRMDSGHITNKKVRLLCNEFDSDGYFIWSSLIDYAYGKWGYYFDMNDPEEMELFASEYCKKKLTLVKEVITGCIRRGLFDKAVADSFGILTSYMMQETFIYATSERRDKGSVFELQGDWLLIDFDKDYDGRIPRNLKIVPPKNKILHPKNPQTRQDTDLDKTKNSGPSNDGAPDSDPVDLPVKKKRGGQDARRGIPPPPSREEVDAFFLQQYNPKNPGTWYPDRCKREAADFYDHYKACGWVQGKGRKPIISWEAAASKWIRTAKDGTYSNSFTPPPPEVPKVVTPADQRTSGRNKMATDINYLYERYVEDPEKFTILSIEVSEYDYLKNAGKISFEQDKVKEIHDMAIAELDKKSIEKTEPLIRAYMKKFGVLEFFKACNAQGLTEIFK